MSEDTGFDFDAAEEFLMDSFEHNARLSKSAYSSTGEKAQASIAAAKIVQAAIELERFKSERASQDDKGPVSRLKTVDKMS